MREEVVGDVVRHALVVGPVDGSGSEKRRHIECGTEDGAVLRVGAHASGMDAGVSQVDVEVESVEEISVLGGIEEVELSVGP